MNLNKLKNKSWRDYSIRKGDIRKGDLLLTKKKSAAKLTALLGIE